MQTLTRKSEGGGPRRPSTHSLQHKPNSAPTKDEHGHSLHRDCADVALGE